MRVVVVGGGFAGLSAAIHLQERRHDVLLLERRGLLGGRATSFRDAWSGSEVDNGTHLLIAGYEATLALLRRAGAEALLEVQPNLRIDWVDEHGYASLSCPPLVAPLHLVAGILGLRVPWRVRWQALRLGLQAAFAAPPQGLNLADYLAKCGQGVEARRLVWDPLATAILNETPERAAASLFHRVFQEAFLTSHAASRLVFVRRGLSALHERLAEYFLARGGEIRRRALVEAVELEGDRVAGVAYSQRAESREEIQAGRPPRLLRVAAPAVVLAVPWSAVPGLLPEPVRSARPFVDLPRLLASPIVSVELWLDRVVVDRVMLGLRDSEVEWVFDKGRLFGRAGAPQQLAFVISAAQRSLPHANAELVGAATRALRRYFPAMKQATVMRSLVLREPAATFCCDPAREQLRPPNRTPVRGLYLAGDWTATGLPATIEGAVRSGRAVAAAIEADGP